MRVLRTVTSENSAATKAVGEHQRKDGGDAKGQMGRINHPRLLRGLMRGWRGKRSPACAFGASRAATRRLLRSRVDEGVDGGLIGRVDLLELQPMPTRRSLHETRADLDFTGPAGSRNLTRGSTGIERAGGPDGDPAAREIQRERRRDRVPEAVCDRDAQDDSRLPPVEAVGRRRSATA